MPLDSFEHHRAYDYFKRIRRIHGTGAFQTERRPAYLLYAFYNAGALSFYTDIATRKRYAYLTGGEYPC